MDTSRGAVWRKWDLHVHTPLTQMNNAYGDESVWDSFIEHLENSDVDVIGITDYNTPVNYFEFLRRLKINHPKSRKTYFFNLELRLEVSVNKAAEEVNIHVIFDNKIPDFEKKINKFLTRLETSGSKGGAVVAYSDLGPGEHVGAAASSYRQITDELVKAFGKSHPYVVVGASNNAGLRPDTKSKRKRITTDSIDQECDGFFGNPEGREYFLDKGRYDDNNEAALSKPVFGGSDAHSMDDLKNWLGKQFTVTGTNRVITSKFITWIKADPSFEGLKQVFNEPKTRVYLGELPPKLRVIDENKTDYIESVNVYDRTGTGKKWFDSSIPLNPGLVAIIGKKEAAKVH